MTHLYIGTPGSVPFNPGDYWMPRRLNVTNLQVVKTEDKPADPTEFKIRRAGTNGAHVIVLLDESSSMQRRLSETTDGLNTIIENHKKGDIETFFSLYTFDGRGTNTIYDKVNVQSVTKVRTVGALGSTNLNDAIGDTLKAISEKLKGVKKADRNSVELIIITDGEENCSRTFSHSKVKELIATAESKNWATTFIGANYDVAQDSASYGFSSARTMSFSDADSQSAYRSIAASSVLTKSLLNAGENLNTVYAATEAGLKDGGNGKA